MEREAIKKELRVLKYFLAVAREENITRAAEQLHVSRPAVSRQIAQLEEKLGIRAFERKGKRVTLTEEGRLLRRRTGCRPSGDTAVPVAGRAAG